MSKSRPPPLPSATRTGSTHFPCRPQINGYEIRSSAVALRSIETNNLELAEKIRTEADYFHKNAMCMRYPKFRRQHLFAGAGGIEAGCKTAIGSRLKQPGMFWTVRGANAIIALRCRQFNGRFEDYWETRRAA